jgi:hypothetical protein
MSDKTASSRTLELFVRSLSSSATSVGIGAIIEQLDLLQADGSLDDYTVTIWGDRLSTDSTVARTDKGAFIHHRIAEFRQWAHEHDAVLEGGFETRTIHSSITDETHEFITLPSLALTARRNGSLEWVVPSSQGGGPVTTVRDRLVSLSHDEQPEESEQSVRVADT